MINFGNIVEMYINRSCSFLVLNCVRLLTRVLPYIFEDPDWRGFFWSTLPGQRNDDATEVGQLNLELCASSLYINYLLCYGTSRLMPPLGITQFDQFSGPLSVGACNIRQSSMCPVALSVNYFWPAIFSSTDTRCIFSKLYLNSFLLAY